MINRTTSTLGTTPILVIHLCFKMNYLQEQRIYDECSEYLTNYVKTYAYYDMFLICAPHGHVMFTIAKESDWGTNLGHGPYKDEALAYLWQKVVATEEVVIEDFSPYAPSDGEQSAFIGAPIYDPTDRLVGVIVLQIPTEPIKCIISTVSQHVNPRFFPYQPLKADGDHAVDTQA